MIHFKHIRQHGISTQEYKQLYPDSPMRIQTESSKKKAGQTKKGRPSKLKGQTKSDEHRKNLSKSLKDKYSSGEIKHWNLGKETPTHVKQKISESNKITINIGNVNQRAQKHARMQATAHLFDCTILSICDTDHKTTAQCNLCNLTFTFTNQIFYPTRISKIGKLCPQCQPRQTYSSKSEKEVYEFIKSIYEGPVIANDRSVLGGKEIDAYCPDKKLGFEFTGLYWHAQNQNPENKHLLWKMQFAASEGVNLITIFEDEWLNKQDIVKSRIRGMFGLHASKIYARNCTVRVVQPKIKNQFLIANHLQGKDASSINLGLYSEDELVSVATFKKTNMIKGGKGDCWELSRFCSKLDHRIIGGASKLIQYFMREVNKDNLALISYADRRWSSGSLYSTLGFQFLGASQPSYWYTKDYKTRVHRSALMKHTLIESESDRQLTEWELAQRAGFDRIWDCGTTKWILHPGAPGAQQPG